MDRVKRVFGIKTLRKLAIATMFVFVGLLVFYAVYPLQFGLWVESQGPAAGVISIVIFAATIFAIWWVMLIGFEQDGFKIRKWDWLPQFLGVSLVLCSFTYLMIFQDFINPKMRPGSTGLKLRKEYVSWDKFKEHGWDEMARRFDEYQDNRIKDPERMNIYLQEMAFDR